MFVKLSTGPSSGSPPAAHCDDFFPASSLHIVPKKDGSWRPGGDNRRLNLVTTLDKYPLPNMQDLSNGLHGCTVFSKFNLVKGLTLCKL
jgi:hypothetical protein